MQTRKLALAALCALAVGGAQAGQYVLQAPKWGANQANAVARAGGTVTYANGDAGIAVVQSNNPNFLATALAAGTITSGAADIVAQFAEPTPALDASAVATAGTTAAPKYYAYQWNVRSVNAPAAWAAGYDGRGVRVAVVDGGIDASHRDLAGAVDIAASRSFVPAADATDTCGPAFNCDLGVFWHGTHVAGIIAARGIGVTGIAPKATIIGVKALNGGSGSFGSIISAVLYASTDAHADIINMSLGAEFGRSEQGAAELRSALNRAINFATAHGSLVVVAAGNSGIDFDHPATSVCDPTTKPVTYCPSDYTVTPAESGNAIAISATGPKGFATGATDFTAPAYYSNYGSSLVWVAAPGGNDSLYPNPNYVFDMVLSLSAGNSYFFADGTSMAAPAASAVAALIKQRNPSATPALLKAILAQSASDQGKVGADDFYGRGFIDAARAVGAN
jgi:subtilisin family serine protease